MSSPSESALFPPRARRLLQLGGYAYGDALGRSTLAVDRMTRRRRPSTVLFTDSRGYNIGVPRHRRNPLTSYGKVLSQSLRIHPQIDRHRPTTLVRFIEFADSRKPPDIWIVHAGIVDFSPRPLSHIEGLLRAGLGGALYTIFPRKELENHWRRARYGWYRDEELTNLYSLEMAERYLVPRLQSIPNLVWIGCNRVLPYWHGTYGKPRPDAIALVEEYSCLLVDQLPNSIDLSGWTDAQIMKFTVDNVHLSNEGADELAALTLKTVRIVTEQL